MKRAAKIIGILILILLVVAIALPFLVNVNSFRPTIETQASSALGRKVTIGNLKLSILSGSVSADDLAIADDPRSEEHTSELQSRENLVCRLLLEKKKKKQKKKKTPHK